MSQHAEGETTNDGYDFETWFDLVAMKVLAETGVAFRDEDSVRDDFECGKNHDDVADDIIAEYND